MVPSYPKIFAVGHRMIHALFDDVVVVEEKVDGSQFSMMRSEAGELFCRSRGKQLDLNNPEKMFMAALDVASTLDLTPGWVYRCEYLQKPKHNCLAYSRIPQKHLVVFDIERGPGDFLWPAMKGNEAARLGLEVVPLFFSGEITGGPNQLKEFWDRESFLGGPKIEGIVVKGYDRFMADGKLLLGKFVRPDFQEANSTNWKKENPTNGDVIDNVIELYRCTPRWEKAVQHLREAGTLTDSPADIGPLLKEINRDVLEEEADAIKEILFRHAWKQIQRGITRGFPEWYKEKLIEVIDEVA